MVSNKVSVESTAERKSADESESPDYCDDHHTYSRLGYMIGPLDRL